MVSGGGTVAPVRLSAAAARRVALGAQALVDGRPAGRVDLRHVRRALGAMGLVQIDSVNVLVRSHELPLWSRLGAYPRGVLDELAFRRRELFEYWGHEASYVPVGLHPHLRHRMERYAALLDRRELKLQKEDPDYVERVLDDVRRRGPLAVTDLQDGGDRAGPWWGWSKGKVALEYLFGAGRLAVAGRRNFARLYDLPERVLPAEVLAAPTPDRRSAYRELLVLGARSVGVGTAADVADYYRLRLAESKAILAELVDEGRLLPAEVEGWRQPAYLHPEARRPRRAEAAALLTPFDPVVWFRDRTERLYGFRYRIEIYTPAPKRVYGYYVLPFLLGDRLVARADLKAQRAAGVLEVRAAHAEPEVDHREVAAALAEELRAMSAWLGLGGVEVVPAGDLAPALSVAVAAG